jgi:hypothetical protein
MYHGLRLVVGQNGAQLSELLELRAEKKMSLITPCVTPQIEGLSDDEMSELIALCQEKKLCLSSVSSTNVLYPGHYLTPAGTAFVGSPLGLGIRSPAHNDSVAYVRTGRCLIQPAATATLSSHNPIISIPFYINMYLQARLWEEYFTVVHSEEPRGGS